MPPALGLAATAGAPAATRPSAPRGVAARLSPLSEPPEPLALAYEMRVWHQKLIKKQLITVHAPIADCVNRFPDQLTAARLLNLKGVIIG